MSPVHDRIRIVVVLLLLVTATARAHVQLDAPNGGEVLQVGSTFLISWHVAIAHVTQNWDLWYSTTGSGGPWIPIVMDLPANGAVTGAVFTYLWTVPATPSSSVRIRVRMDNSGIDYYDISDGDLSITAQHLQASPPFISLSSGGSQTFLLDAGPGNANSAYLMLGSLSGTSPGIGVGFVTLPLNPDFYFDFLLTNANTPLLFPSVGFLDGNGTATAVLNLPPGLPPSLLPIPVNHAFVVLPPSGPITFASNPALLTFLP